jgi:hypothetical protein
MRGKGVGAAISKIGETQPRIEAFGSHGSSQVVSILTAARKTLAQRDGAIAYSAEAGLHDTRHAVRPAVPALSPGPPGVTTTVMWAEPHV